MNARVDRLAPGTGLVQPRRGGTVQARRPERHVAHRGQPGTHLEQMVVHAEVGVGPRDDE